MCVWRMCASKTYISTTECAPLTGVLSLWPSVHCRFEPIIASDDTETVVLQCHCTVRLQHHHHH